MKKRKMLATNHSAFSPEKKNSLVIKISYLALFAFFKTMAGPISNM